MDYRACIQQSIDYIEIHLKEDITVEKLAALAGFSSYHYYRVFQFYVGLPVMKYIRKRRIAYAATELLDGRKILDIALDYGFDTHAGFTKAFRKSYGVSPEQYRIHATKRIPEKVDLMKLAKYKIIGGIIMQPKFIVKPAFKLAGYELKTTSNDGKNNTEIPKFWDRYFEENWAKTLHEKITPVNHAELGVCLQPDMKTGNFSYIIGVEVRNFDNIPEGLFKGEINEATYAVFTTPPSDRKDNGFTNTIQGTWNYIWNEWFPESGYEYAPDGVDFELYDERCYGYEGIVMDIYIPVVKKD
ncbi:helix-turn-helix domain protein [Clostridium argentinense CDC 2741]|uniref:Helix-turn-helix domain protein n=1 Tax=Clostridium argentinense CDC 2741 TaxID=1418104 RepID=A0A0C1QU58_9CLOT|nr:AraC family transcriptional regulator [Clostridium argentinense]ARC84301.1 AraC family transcriptional regulator [Clostridium argentinense]KIE44522.1 helix-turn-helix domain protein [Clostridium argentinense CDC 2741]NFF38264.1 AraC family transcriptional regulator [Clostridium argentinense]NFP49151.1 AraC family transcriptional regulator [Clostridium argentinense]NFP71569.1 AraC family transcriptional regulator [Clostridium argentinense]